MQNIRYFEKKYIVSKVLLIVGIDKCYTHFLSVFQFIGYFIKYFKDLSCAVLVCSKTHVH